MIPKIAVVISKKTAKTAVLRHRIKRIMIDILFPFVKNKQGFYGIISLSQLSKEYKKLTTIPEKQLFREELKIIGEKLSKL